ncbi:MAG: hypothetical protein WC005_09980 [Candidatus Nanopelagicales bacterium]
MRTKNMHHAGIGAAPVIAAIDFNQAQLWLLTSSTDETSTRVSGVSPFGLHKVHSTRVGGEKLHQGSSDTAYWEAVAQALKDATDILLLGHGKGKSNASHVFAGYLESHHPDLAHKVIGELRCDIDSLTDAQLISFGRRFLDDLDVLA